MASNTGLWETCLKEKGDERKYQNQKYVMNSNLVLTMPKK